MEEEKNVPKQTSDAHATLNVNDTSLAYGIEPKHLTVSSDTMSETSSVSINSNVLNPKSLITLLLQNQFGKDLKLNRAICVRKAKIYGIRKPVSKMKNTYRVTLFLAGKASDKMMKSPLDICKEDMLEMSFPTEAPTPGKEEERADNEAILSTVYGCIQSVIG